MTGRVGRQERRRASNGDRMWERSGVGEVEREGCEKDGGRKGEGRGIDDYCNEIWSRV